MTKLVVNICGQSTVGKTNILNFLTNRYTELFIPIHFTTRMRRIDDDSFYKYVSQNEINKIQKSRLITLSGEGSHCYGIMKPDTRKSLLLNSSLKDVGSVRQYCIENRLYLMNIILFSSNLEQNLKMTHRFSQDELNYRLKVNSEDFEFLLNSIWENHTDIVEENTDYYFFDRESTSLTDIYDKLQLLIDSKISRKGLIN